MNLLVGAVLAVLLVAGVGVVLAEDPQRQALTLSVFGLVLAVLFLTVRAPDVALSQIAVQTAVVPLMLLLAVRKTAQDAARQESGQQESGRLESGQQESGQQESGRQEPGDGGQRTGQDEDPR